MTPEHPHHFHGVNLRCIVVGAVTEAAVDRVGGIVAKLVARLVVVDVGL